MNKNKKYALLAATIWPFVYFFIFIAFIASTMFAGKSNSDPPAFLLVIFPLHMLTIFLVLALTVLYIINAFKNPLVKGDMKIVWVLLILFFNIGAMPVYWYLYIWCGPENYNTANPGAVPNASPVAPTVKYCPACGSVNAVDSDWCVKCGQQLAPLPPTPQQPTPQPHDDYSIGIIIPYRNMNALLAYYFGVFSVIPLFPIGIVGLVLGLKGLKFAKQHPETRGTTHAWVGIIAGGLFGIAYLLLTLIGIYMSVTQ